jgi:hypothetical protein
MVHDVHDEIQRLGLVAHVKIKRTSEQSKGTKRRRSHDSKQDPKAPVRWLSFSVAFTFWAISYSGETLQDGQGLFESPSHSRYSVIMIVTTHLVRTAAEKNGKSLRPWSGA